MEVSLSCRMGGPEAGAAWLASIVQLRPKLKSALADLSVNGLGTIDIQLWIGGSITDYGPEGFSSTARYYAKKESLLLAISVPKTVAAASPQERPEHTVEDWLADGFRSAQLPRSAQKLPFALIAETVCSSLGTSRQ
ncbi:MULTISPECIES: hypothetical protein [Achromobacter]|uniref:hypothetical protein n=1 Tax=Achromobacter sp. ACM03 TaxID=2769300 RepID=UPI00177BA4E8|nr:hypothetical protein [Achromobacter sp. ACM03]MBD9428873.1 hypothetical protein [Achromobacter sp. ACM03]